MGTESELGFIIDFLVRNTSPVYLAGVLASFVAVGVTTFLTWNLKSTPISAAANHRMSARPDHITGNGEDDELTAEEELADDEDSSSVRRRVVTPVEKSEDLTEEERMEERRVIQKQMREIYALMKSEEGKFGGISLADMQDQLRYYKK